MMDPEHLQQPLESILTEMDQESVQLLTDEAEHELVQDVAGDLEVFIQLAKTGHYDRAMPFFNVFLEHHSSLFPVTAEYADALLEQGAFGQADDYLSAILEAGSSSAMETTVMQLLSAIAKLHTSLEQEHAVELAASTLQGLHDSEARRLDVKEV